MSILPPVAQRGTVSAFAPTTNDVVSTKLRSWNAGHPGNLFYADLLVEHALKLPPPTDPGYNNVLREITNRLVEIIILERGGRFLKISEGERYPDSCVVMDPKACRHKVLHGLKHKQKMILTKGLPPKPPKISKPPTKEDQILAAANPVIKPPKPPKPSLPRPWTANTAEIVSPGSVGHTTVRKRKPKKFDDELGNQEAGKPKKPRRRRVTKYIAQQRADGGINPYALELISHVCNHPSESFLERPLDKFSTPEEEPNKEREIRLALRHRFFCAIAGKVPVLEFAKKLMEIWGGKLCVNSKLVHSGGDLPSSCATSPGTLENTTVISQSPGGGSSEELKLDAAPTHKIPQKEPRKFPPIIDPPLEIAPGNAWGEIATGGQDRVSGSSSRGDTGSSSGEGSDGESQEEETPTYDNPFGFGYYGTEAAGGTEYVGQSESDARSEGASVESEGNGFQYAEEYDDDPRRRTKQESFYDANENTSPQNHELSILSAAANYQLEALKVQPREDHDEGDEKLM